MKKKIIGISMAVLGFGAVAALNFGIAVNRNNLSGSLSLDNVEALAAETKMLVQCYKKLEGLHPNGYIEVIICPENHTYPVVDDCPKKQWALLISPRENYLDNLGICMTDAE